MSAVSLFVTPPTTRAVLCRDDAGGINAIQLNSPEKKSWWLRFTGHSSGQSDPSTVRDSVPVRDLCFILGATGPDIGDSSPYRLVPGLSSSRTIHAHFALVVKQNDVLIHPRVFLSLLFYRV